MNRQADTIDDYVEGSDPEMALTAREVVAIMREALPGADERVQWGMAIFSRDGKDLTGIGVRKGFFTLYSPDADITAKYGPLLGSKDCGKGCIRFKPTDELDRAQLRAMLGEMAGRR